MGNELVAQFATGSVLYAHVLSGGAVYNGSAFDATPTSGEWATYSIPMTEAGGSGYYRANFPAVAAGHYSYLVMLQQGGSPASTDPSVWAGEVLWDGAALATPSATGDAMSLTGGAVSGLVDDIWAGITAAAGNFIADHTLRRPMANVEGSANGDALSLNSLYGAVMAKFKSAISSGLWVVKKTDGTTLGTKAISAAAGDPVTGVDDA